MIILINYLQYELAFEIEQEPELIRIPDHPAPDSFPEETVRKKHNN